MGLFRNKYRYRFRPSVYNNFMGSSPLVTRHEVPLLDDATSRVVSITQKDGFMKDTTKFISIVTAIQVAVQALAEVLKSIFC